ncbi:MAG TPA: hypothetical protein VNL71_12900 [Chloroflexota bacterium]|nr:hypothetical protein [Chloroflexota bacterium]
MPGIIERREARLRKTGGSRSLTIPHGWLTNMDISDRVELIYTGNTIEIVKAPTALDLEDRPEFARFLEFMAQSALAHPDRLRNAADVMAGDEELFSGVEAEDV